MGNTPSEEINKDSEQIYPVEVLTVQTIINSIDVNKITDALERKTIEYDILYFRSLIPYSCNYLMRRQAEKKYGKITQIFSMTDIKKYFWKCVILSLNMHLKANNITKEHKFGFDIKQFELLRTLQTYAQQTSDNLPEELVSAVIKPHPPALLFQ